MWLSIFLQASEGDVDQKQLDDAIDVTSRWTDDLLEYLLATLFCTKQAVNATIAATIAKNDHRSSSSVIVKRHHDQF